MKAIDRIIKEYVTRDGKNHFRSWHDGLKNIKKAAGFWEEYIREG